jgi:diaminohydroxyphosphoribosylaminopyrimidine deaminase/5-amino-6-(5-phosphoribosylamino)uracil reductase
MTETAGSDGLPPDPSHMRRALELAEEGWGRVSPNPLVGAVVVRGSRVVGEGYHAELGAPHAEVVALRQAGDAARDATLYVTLEPCAHHGRTPPCTEAILAAGVRRVVLAARDPSKEARGGTATLRAAGVLVEEGLLEDEALRLNAPFFWSHRTGRPFVALKLAVSLDGGVAAAAGRRTEISGREARAEAMRLRAGSDAILVGSGTARVDDPLLTVRERAVPRTPPLRVILDTEARTGPDSRLARTVNRAPLLIVTARNAAAERIRALEEAGAEIVALPAGPGGLDPEEVLEALWERGVRSVLCEGGARVAATLLARDHVQRLHLFVSPVWLGPGHVPAFDGLAARAAGWRGVGARVAGRDVLATWESERAWSRMKGDD